MTSRNSGKPGVGPYFVQPSSSARFPASRMWAGVGKSGSPISRWMTFLPCFSNARAFARTSKADSVPIRDIFSASRMVEVVISLHQRSRPARPGLSFFFRHRLHVFHVCRSLRQDVMEVVTDADKREPFVDKLANT